MNNPSQADDDGDGIGNVCDNLNDSDGDGVADDIDNCPSTPNANQADDDGDGIGNACDNDADNDGVPNGQDNCVTVHNPGQEDSDGDGIGDVCDNFNDGDGDGNSDGNDNCPLIPNPGQDDLDGDGIGDVCDDDMDGDGVPNNGDNCEAVANPGQEDVDQDGIGDVCDSNNSTDPFDYSCTEPPGFAITPETPGALSSGVLRGTSGDDFIVGGPEVRTIFPLDGRDKICANYGWDSSGNDNQIVLGRGSKYVYARTPTNDNLRIDEKRNPEYVNNPGGTRNYIYAYRPPNGSATSLGVGIGLDSTESGGAEGFEFTYCEMEWYEPDVVIYEGEGANFAYSNMGCADGSYAEVVGDFMNPDVEDSGGIISIRELSADAKFSVVMGERLNSYLMLPMQSSIDGTLQRSWNIHGRVEALLRNNFLDGTKASAPGLALYSGLVYTSTESTIRFTNTTGSNANGERGHFVACDGDEDPNIGLRYGGISPGGGLAFIQWDNASSNFVDYGEDCGTPSAGTYLITRPNPATFLGY
ncbi:MAG: thrombospondin type 3 repeat-containing protein [Salinisphaeraceae bacterium]